MKDFTYNTRRNHTNGNNNNNQKYNNVENRVEQETMQFPNKVCMFGADKPERTANDQRNNAPNTNDADTKEEFNWLD